MRWFWFWFWRMLGSGRVNCGGPTRMWHQEDHRKTNWRWSHQLNCPNPNPHFVPIITSKHFVLFLDFHSHINIAAMDVIIIVIFIPTKIAIKTKEMKKRRCLTATSEVYSTVILLIIGERGVQFKRTYLD